MQETCSELPSGLCWGSLGGWDIGFLLLLSSSALHSGCLLPFLIGAFDFPSDLNEMGSSLLRFIGLLF